VRRRGGIKRGTVGSYAAQAIAAGREGGREGGRERGREGGVDEYEGREGGEGASGERLGGELRLP